MGRGWTGAGGRNPTRLSPTRHVILHGGDRRRAKARGQCAPCRAVGSANTGVNQTNERKVS